MRHIYILVTDHHENHLQNTFDVILEYIQIELTDCNSNPRDGNILHELVEFTISA